MYGKVLEKRESIIKYDQIEKPSKSVQKLRKYKNIWESRECLS